jgi:hypothetical protein
VLFSKENALVVILIARVIMGFCVNACSKRGGRG